MVLTGCLLMSARENLIRAYAFSTLKPSSGGDFDLGARGTHEPCRRKSRGKFTDPQYAKQSKQKAINTSNIIMNGLIAGKIISSAEGNKAHRQAFSRIYYSEAPMRRDTAILGSYLTRRVLEVESLKNGILECSDVILKYATGRAAMRGQAREDIIRHLDHVVSRLEHRILRDVGICVKELDNPR